jgi:niacin transporter
MKRSSIYQICTAALLIAIGVVIPLFSPIKVILEPASFTLASHVAIFVGMFISPGVAVAVSIGTTAGFFLGGFAPVIVLRAASHVVFAFIGAMYLQKYRNNILDYPIRSQLFSLVIGIIHTVCEIAVVTWFYVGGSMGVQYYQQGFIRSIVLLLGLGGLVHSMVDFAIALVIVKVLFKQSAIFNKAPV